LIGQESPSGRLRARLVEAASDLGATMTPLAHLYVADAEGALRTLLGDAHMHPIGVYPSWKTGLAQPYDGLTEPDLIQESEVDPDIVDYQTQAFRLQYGLMSGSFAWICDHFRQYRDGRVEAIEVKRTPQDMSPDYLLKMQVAREILGRVDIDLVIRYDRDINGCAWRTINRGHILAHRSFHVGEAGMATFERIFRRTDVITMGELRLALDTSRVRGVAAIHALMCAGRIDCDRTMPIHDGTELRLLAPPSFISRIRF
jgi:hypothetical protein